MNSKTYLLTALLSFAAAAAQSHEYTSLDDLSKQTSAKANNTWQASASDAASSATHGMNASSTQPLTRAEVLADLQLYRESGFAELDRADVPQWESPAYKAAAERYAALRASPRYAALVQQYGGPQRADSVALSGR